MSKNSKMQVAIVTLYDDYNIGNKLQNYALQELIRLEGYIPVTINTSSFGIWKLSWKGWLVTLVGFPRQASHYRRLMLRRKALFRNFSRQYLNVSKEISYKSILNGKLSQFDAFVCGSDQVWHNWTGKKEELDYFFLRFAEKTKRLCYAPSFGFDEVPENMRRKYSEGLMGFEKLSCREQSGCDLIERLTGRKAERLCDPTMMLTTEQWDKIALQPNVKLPEKYLLTYFLGSKNSDDENKINTISKKLKLKIVNIYCMDFNKENDPYFCTRPDEFLYLIKHASYVCTDSFHGAVFSILYHKDFTSFQRRSVDGIMMKNRLNTLLKLFRLEKCENTDQINKNIDYSYADKVLEFEREKGKKFLREALSEAVCDEV